MRGSRPACCTRAIGYGRWSCIAASRWGGCRRCSATRTIPVDQRFLTLGLRDAAKAEWERAPPQVRAALERYAAGVNADHGHVVGRKRPLEFQMLGITPPEWEPVDSLAVGRLLAWRLAENHQAELVRAALPRSSASRRRGNLTGVYPAIGAGDSAGARAAGSDEPMRAASHGGSRCRRQPPPGLEWLMPARGAATATTGCWPAGAPKGGRPILANDPHLQIEFPSVWYEMHLVAAGLDVIGVTIPGVPFIALGHNARIAWGMTSTGADVQDLALERVDVGKKRSMYRGEWVPIETHQGRHSGARAQRAAAVRGVEDAQRADLRRRRSRLGSAAVVAVARRSSRRGAQGLFAALGRRRRSGDRVRGDQPRHRLDVVQRRDRVVRRAVDEHRLRRCRRQHRLRDVGQAAGARVRRRHDAGRRQFGAGVDRIDRARRAAARVQSGVGLHLFGQQRDRSRLQPA